MASSRYGFFDARLETLQIWPGLDSHDVSNIARSGLYYLNVGKKDILRCAFCEFVIANLKSNDDVWKLHAEFVPSCLHLLCCKGLEYVKGILEKDGYNEEIQDNTVMFAQCLKPKVLPDLTISGIIELLERRQHSSSSSPSSRSGSANVYKTYGGVPFRYPKHKDMVDENVRRATFSVVLGLDNLAEAGFYYTGHGDSVRCYHCGIGFQNWNSSDDPWFEHARSVPNCMHVILTKGEEFVQKVLKDVNAQRATSGAGKRKLDFDEDDSSGRNKKKIQVEESCAGGNSEQGGAGPSLGAGKRKFDFDEDNLNGPNKKASQVEESSEQRDAGPTLDDRALICVKCHREGTISETVCSLCCKVCVCESCLIPGEPCPICHKA